MYWLWCPLLAYFLGSLPFGLFIARMSCGIDLREQGSCNTGATNVARLCGVKWGLCALLLDMLKGYIPVYMDTEVSTSIFFISLVALVAVLGHVFSPFLRFRGGKAVATSIGAFAALAPATTLVCVLLAILVIADLCFGSARLLYTFWCMVVYTTCLYTHPSSILATQRKHFPFIPWRRKFLAIEEKMHSAKYSKNLKRTDPLEQRKHSMMELNGGQNLVIYF